MRFAFIMLAALLVLPPAPAFSADNSSVTPASSSFEKMDPRAVLSELKFDNEEDLEESRRTLESSLAFDPGNPDYHFELSRVYGALYDNSVRKDKKNPNAIFLSRSENELEQVLMIRPNDIPAHYNLGVIYKRRARTEKAREEFQRVLQFAKIEENHVASTVVVSAWMQIGATYEDQGFFEEAQDAYMKAREIAGPQPEVVSALEDLRSHEKDALRLSGSVPRGDTWTRQFVSGADYTRFGADALKAQSQSAGIGALLPVAGALLFQQFMDRRAAKAAQNDAGGLPPPNME